jgi:hypothetical protein
MEEDVHKSINKGEKPKINLNWLHKIWKEKYEK